MVRSEGLYGLPGGIGRCVKHQIRRVCLDGFEFWATGAGAAIGVPVMCQPSSSERPMISFMISLVPP